MPGGPTDQRSPNDAASFAFETFASALAPLLVLGVLMDFLVGIVGGTIGKALQVTGR